jgi:hypothetical protein
MVLTGQVLIERLLALVPRPRRHLVTYHGVLAPAASLRSRVVPRTAAELENGAGQDDADAASADNQHPEALHKMAQLAGNGLKSPIDLPSDECTGDAITRGPSCCDGCTPSTCSHVGAAVAFAGPICRGLDSCTNACSRCMASAYTPTNIMTRRSPYQLPAQSSAASCTTKSCPLSLMLVATSQR